MDEQNEQNENELNQIVLAYLAKLKSRTPEKIKEDEKIFMKNLEIIQEGRKEFKSKIKNMRKFNEDELNNIYYEARA